VQRPHKIGKCPVYEFSQQLIGPSIAVLDEVPIKTLRSTNLCDKDSHMYFHRCAVPVTNIFGVSIIAELYTTQSNFPAYLYSDF
jgi:hypothetical protein